jgi:hypothetical protein
VTEPSGPTGADDATAFPPRARPQQSPGVPGTATPVDGTEIGYRDGVAYFREAPARWAALIDELRALRGVDPAALQTPIKTLHVGPYESCERCGTWIVATLQHPDWALRMAEVRHLWRRVDRLLEATSTAAVGKYATHRCVRRPDRRDRTLATRLLPSNPNVGSFGAEESP